MIVKEQNKIVFINDCGCIVDYDELEKAILWYQNKPTVHIKHIYLHGRYPAISIHKQKIHIHRLLMLYWCGVKKLNKNLYIHHIDENKLNATKENLRIIFASAHQSIHNKGKIISQSQRESIIESNCKRKGVKRGIIKLNISYKAIWDLWNNGYSINKISKQLNYDWGQVKIRLQEIHDNPELLEK